MDSLGYDSYSEIECVQWFFITYISQTIYYIMNQYILKIHILLVRLNKLFWFFFNPLATQLHVSVLCDLSQLETGLKPSVSKILVEDD